MLTRHACAREDPFLPSQSNQEGAPHMLKNALDVSISLYAAGFMFGHMVHVCKIVRNPESRLLYFFRLIK